MPNINLPEPNITPEGWGVMLNAAVSAINTQVDANTAAIVAGGTVGPPPILSTTSTTSNTIASSGSKTFALASPTQLAVGMVVRVANTASIWMVGAITAVSATSLTLTVTGSSGSGTFTSWTIALVGERGPTGSTGAAATITGATVTGLPAGSNPGVTLGGTSSARTFAFELPSGPQGAKGDTGAQGPAGPQGPTGPYGDYAAMGGLTLQKLTQAQYDALSTKSATTLYLIVG